MSADAQPAAAAAAPKKGRGKLLMIVAVLVVAGAGGGYWWMSRSAVEAAPKAIPLSQRGLVTFEPFMVNLADGSNRYLKLNVQLVLETPHEAEAVLTKPVVLSHLRSGLLELLTEQTATTLVTTEGKAALKAAIRERAAASLEGREVIDVLFSEFVVQF